MSFAVISSLVFALTQFADGITTYFGLKRGGKESNPLLRWLAKSPIAVMFVKFGIGVGVPVVEFWGGTYMPGLVVMFLVSIPVGFVVGKNTIRLVKGHN